MRGRSKFGGQRLGEMEVWALEGYGAAFTLLEMLTIKSDDITGRMTLWSNLILHHPIYIGTPESFKVLICELQALCLDIGLFKFSDLSNGVGTNERRNPSWTDRRSSASKLSELAQSRKSGDEVRAQTRYGQGFASVQQLIKLP